MNYKLLAIVSRSYKVLVWSIWEQLYGDIVVLESFEWWFLIDIRQIFRKKEEKTFELPVDECFFQIPEISAESSFWGMEWVFE